MTNIKIEKTVFYTAIASCVECGFSIERTSIFEWQAAQWAEEVWKESYSGDDGKCYCCTKDE